MKMSENAKTFAEHYEMYCVGNKKLLQIKYDAEAQSWAAAVDKILNFMGDDVAQHIAVTGDSLEIVRKKIEEKLCAAAEDENDQPTIFPINEE